MLGTPIRFDYTGAAQTYTVPAGVIGFEVDCIGAAGGADPYGFRSGLGGRVQAKLNVTAGDILYIYVGEQGKYSPTTTNSTNSSAFNGGGFSYRGVPPGSLGSNSLSGYGAGGGGASDIRLNGTALSDRKIVAGGGGGGFVTANNMAPQTGGAGGGLTGGNGGVQVSGEGQGGSQSAGGGRYGSLGNGGGFNSQNGTTTGGGGGYYGGGAGQAYLAGGGAGGGGSSYTDPTLCTDVVHTQGYSAATGNGWIILTPILPDAYERDPSADKAVIMHSKTYNAFTAAGYDEIGTLHGVYLKNIPDEYGISDAEYITIFEDQVGNLANKAHLMQYIGNKAVVDVPIGKKQG